MSGAYLATKRFLDVVLSILFLVLVAPLIGILIIIITLDSPGPGLYKSERLGRDGSPFDMWKLRTMVDGADDFRQDIRREKSEAVNGAFFKDPSDWRMTKFGRLLRRSSLDELPQLWNVIVGDMSLVGPRPSFPEEMKEISQEALRRLSVKPGMTGPWQVSGRSSLPFSRAMELDLYYVDHASFWLDILILFRTIPAVLSRKGAF